MVWTPLGFDTFPIYGGVKSEYFNRYLRLSFCEVDMVWKVILLTRGKRVFIFMFNIEKIFFTSKARFENHHKKPINVKYAISKIIIL